VDVVFAPSDDEMYPAGPDSAFSTFVVEESLSKGMEGVSRPTHFRGVATVVAKLFHLAQPDVAVFGAKDFQQAAVVERMARDLDFPVRIEVAPTHREPDGLAMSSRNRYLTPEQRQQATVLWEALQSAGEAVRQRAIPAEKLTARIGRLVSSRPAARLDYVAFFDPHTLKPVATVRRGARMALAVFFGPTRLIDNAAL
jgi:pantoate--beta-alanine ligase